MFSHTPTFRRTSGVRHHSADDEAPALPGKSLTVRSYLCARGGTPEEDSFSLSPSRVRTPSLTGTPAVPFVVALVGSPLRRRTSPYLPRLCLKIERAYTMRQGVTRDSSID